MPIKFNPGHHQSAGHARPGARHLPLRRLHARPDLRRRRRPDGGAVPADSDCLSGAAWCALLRSVTGWRASLGTVCA
jgi:hypothetical protein